MQKTVFSGIQPSGSLHIGNYIGAIKQWIQKQDEGQNIFCIVDLHAITVEQDPKTLYEKSLELAAIYLASGIDPDKDIIFIQSHNPDHANLAWILNCQTSMGQLNRMTQFKDKSENKDFVGVGLFTYPVLMAADILLYDTTEVPVGDDQKQHVELTRDLAERFNSKYDQTFTIPEPKIPQYGARIRSLKNPDKKMSKSDSDPMSYIYLLDPPELIQKKIMSATTDSENHIKYDMENKPGISNLIDIYIHFTDQTIEQIELQFQDKGYGDFKKAVAESIIQTLQPIQQKYHELRQSDHLDKILEDGAKKAYALSHPKLLEVQQKMGFIQ